MMSGRQSPDPSMVHVWALYALGMQGVLWIWGAVLVALLIVSWNAIVAVSLLLVSLVIGASTSYAWAFLYHRFYLWEFTDEQMHVWRGILFRRRLTVPYMRVQNATVVRGPFLMLFGLSNVAIETAAAGAHPYPVSTGFSPGSGAYLPGVRDGEQVADAIIEAAKRSRVREGL